MATRKVLLAEEEYQALKSLAESAVRTSEKSVEPVINTPENSCGPETGSCDCAEAANRKLIVETVKALKTLSEQEPGVLDWDRNTFEVKLYGKKTMPYLSTEKLVKTITLCDGCSIASAENYPAVLPRALRDLCFPKQLIQNSKLLDKVNNQESACQLATVATALSEERQQDTVPGSKQAKEEPKVQLNWLPYGSKKTKNSSSGQSQSG